LKKEKAMVFRVCKYFGGNKITKNKVFVLTFFCTYIFQECLILQDIIHENFVKFCAENKNLHPIMLQNVLNIVA